MKTNKFVSDNDRLYYFDEYGIRWDVTDIEFWAPIPEYEGRYEASNFGRIRSYLKRVGKRTKPKILSPGLNRQGYEVVVLTSKPNKKKTKLVSRLVAKTFIENPENKPHINHLNAVPDDNRVENLEWCTRSENMRHAFDTGLLSRKGEKHGGSKLKAKDIPKIFELYESGLTQKEISEKYDVHRVTISMVLRRENWGHIDL